MSKNCALNSSISSDMNSGHPQPKFDVEYDRKSEVEAFESTKSGVKGLFDSGISKIPRIFLDNTTTTTTSNPGEQSFCMRRNLEIPIIDLQGISRSSEEKKEVVKQIKHACEEWGFFQVINHGIPATTLDEISKGFKRFHEMEDELKKPYYSRDVNRKFKYNANFDLFSSKVANWRDSLSCIMGPELPDPLEFPEFCRDIIFEYTKELKRLGNEVLELMSEALGLRSDYLKKLELTEGIYLQGNYYPPCPEPDRAIGITSHADNSFFTILLQDNIGGLQILHQNQWVDVRPSPHALVINVGDLLQLITNDRFKSVYHRVLLVKGVGARISVPCFFKTHFLAEEQCRLYGPIKELLSDKYPAIYREITLTEFMKYFYEKGLDGTSTLSHFKLSQS